MARYLSNGIRAPDLGSPVPGPMPAAAAAALESEKKMKQMLRMTENLKQIKNLIRGRYHRRRRLPVWEGDEDWWWRRRKRSSMADWPPNVREFFQSMQNEVGEEDGGAALEDVDDEGNDTHQSAAAMELEDMNEEEPLKEIKQLMDEAPTGANVRWKLAGEQQRGEELTIAGKLWPQDQSAELARPEPPVPPEPPDLVAREAAKDAAGVLRMAAKLPSLERRDLEAKLNMMTEALPETEARPETAVRRSPLGANRSATEETSRSNCEGDKPGAATKLGLVCLLKCLPPPESPDLETGAITVEAASSTMAALAVPLSCCVKKDDRWETNRGCTSLGQLSDLMGQAQLIEENDFSKWLVAQMKGTEQRKADKGNVDGIKKLIHLLNLMGQAQICERADFWNKAIKLVVALYGVLLVGPGGSVATVTKYMVNGALRNALQKNGSSSLVSKNVDVFSLDIVMWELLTGEEPYADLHYGAIIDGLTNKFKVEAREGVSAVAIKGRTVLGSHCTVDDHTISAYGTSLGVISWVHLVVILASNPWDPGGKLNNASSLPFFLKIWDPGGSFLFFSTIVLLYVHHLEGKVIF